MKTILVTGSNGLLGQKITSRLLSDKQFHLVATAKGMNRFPLKEGYTYAEMDILDPARVLSVIEQYKPDAIIHTAAMTNADTCETEKEQAYQLNVEAVKTMLSLCEKYHIQFVHLSTDFIFDGANGPYDEMAAPNPLSYYGNTKLEAEEVIKSSTCRWVILRTVLVYGILDDMSRSNIVLWAKNALETKTPISVVDDQWRTPTLAEDLADCCLLAVEKDVRGVYNACGKDMMRIVELVYRIADFWDLDKSFITEISSASLNQPAKRPVRTGLILDKAIAELGYDPHSFEEGLAVLDQQIINNTHMALKAGDRAPDFKLFSSELKEVTLGDFKGKKVVLQFFPMAFTGVCTTQLCTMRDSFGFYQGMNAEVLALSVDSPFTLAKFKEEQFYQFPLLSDFNKEISQAYDAFYEEFAYNLKGVSKRAAFVIDEEGKIIYAEVLASAGDLPDFDAIKKILEA